MLEREITIAGLAAVESTYIADKVRPFHNMLLLIDYGR